MHPRRIDLHCHSDASNKTSEAVLNALHCPESYSGPDEVYRQARLRGMDFVTLTDHDTIDGATTLTHHADVLVGEELTCWFPEDGCKMHVLVYGLTPAIHEQLQARAKDIYDVAKYIELNAIAHSVAHPIYRQNDKLERWHLERLLLLFKGFECLNGAHSSLHREAFEPLLDSLTQTEIERLSSTHNIRPHWPKPWVKARTAGSDDHGLLNVGRTWTEFPPNTNTIDDLLKCLREGICQPGGEAGSSAKLAHTFYSVATRYYTRHIMSPGQSPNLATTLLQTVAGERALPSKGKLIRLGVKHKLKKIGKRVLHPLRREPAADAGTNLLKQLFISSATRQIKQHPQLLDALRAGLPALGEHDACFDVLSGINQDITRGLAKAIHDSVDRASFTGLFDSIGALLAQQFVLLPYYFAVFHQNKERHLLREITRLQTPRNASSLKVGLFTDTFDEGNGVSRFLNDLATSAGRENRKLTIHTCTEHPMRGEFNGVRKNFTPALSRPMPYYPQLKLCLPPILDVLEWSDRQQFDVIHVSTPGPMGLVGQIVSKMLRVPLVATYHTDFPAYLDKLAGDHRVVAGCEQFMKWFYAQASLVLTRSNAYRFNLRDLGVADEKIAAIPAGIDLEKFSPSAGLPIKRNTTRTLLYVGRVSREKNLQLLADTFKRLAENRDDVRLILAGEGPFTAELRQQFAKVPNVEFLGHRNDAELLRLYRESDLLIFPSRTDTLGQAVMEAQACGLPAIVSNEGGPKETVEHNVTGLVLASTDPAGWAAAIDDLLSDEPRRLRMSRAAAERMSTQGFAQSFEKFWQDHLRVAEPDVAAAVSPPPLGVVSNA